VVGQPERRARPGQLPDPVAAQLVGPVRGQLGELRRDDLALLPSVQVTSVTAVSGCAA